MAGKKNMKPRIDDNFHIMRSGSHYLAETAHKGRAVVGKGSTVEEAIADCKRQIGDR